MPYGSTLSLTGGASALVLGHFLGLDDIIAAAITAVLFGIAAFRYGSRIGRGRKTIFMLAGAAVFGVAFLAHVGSLSWPTSTAAGLTAAVVYATLTRFDPNLPVWIAEFGCVPGRARAAWLGEMMTTRAFPRLRAVVYFDVKARVDWRLDSSARQAIRSHLRAS